MACMLPSIWSILFFYVSEAVFKIKCAIIAAVLVVLMFPTTASAQPMTGGFQGTVIAGGNSLPDGTVISAWIDGNMVAETETENSEYSLFIHGDYTGKTVSFKVGKVVRW